MGRKTETAIEMFRRLALSMPEAVENTHMGHPDFRVPGRKGKIFATLFCSSQELDDEDRGMVKLTPDQQEEFIARYPAVFSPIPGKWGLHGCTQVDLSRRVSAAVLIDAVSTAWSNAAPARLLITRSVDLSRLGKERGSR